MKLTPLARNLACVVPVSFLAIFFIHIVLTFFLCIALVVLTIYFTPKTTNLTTGDRYMINLDRILQHKNRWGHVAGVMYFEQNQQPSVALAQSVMNQVVLKSPRVGSIAVTSDQVEYSHFRRVLNMDMNYHCREHKIADINEMQKLVQQLVNEKLDPAHPLWRFDILVNASGPCAVLFRIDHCLADGMRLVKTVGGFMFFENGRPAELALLAKMSKKKLSLSQGRGFFGLAVQFLRDLPMALFLDKMKQEDPSCFHVPGTIFDVKEDRVCVTSTVSFQDVKAIRDFSPQGTTINDVILAAFLGALQRYAKAVGEPLVAKKVMRAMCAVSLPDMSSRDKQEMYNHFIMPSFPLVIGLESPLARLQAARQAMNVVKLSLTGLITSQLADLLGRLGLDKIAADTQLRIFPLHSFVYSNVPGMDQPACLFSPAHRITGFEVYFPNLISQVICLTYCDKLTFSLTTTASAIKQPDLLAQAFADEVANWRKEG